jgi:hypothetical protein
VTNKFKQLKHDGHVRVLPNEDVSSHARFLAVPDSGWIVVDRFWMVPSTLRPTTSGDSASDLNVL